VTAIDIVALQLFVAAGGKLSTIPVLGNIPQNGCAIECRLSAEDPHNDFFPEHGTVRLWQTATTASPQLKDVRFETAVETGSRISIYFDSMNAKIVVWAPTRSMAIQKMVRTLSHTVCAGVKTNQLFLQSCLLHESFQDPSYTTSFIPNNLPALLRSPYAAHASKLRDIVALIPALFLRNESRYRSVIRSARPFQKIRSRFRNQRFDPVGLQTDIIVPSDCKPEQNPVLIGWKSSPYESTSQISATTTTLDLSAPSSNSSPATQVTARCNEIRKILRSSDLLQRKCHNLTIESCGVVIVNPNTLSPWINPNFSVSISGETFRASITTEHYNLSSGSMTQTGEGNSIFCHLPFQGTF
jgi:acetyl/propionyl-CoA carboxylase alpha subunit